MPLLSSVEFEEWEDPGEGFSESGDRTRSTASRVYKVAWADRYTFVREVCGWSESVGDEIIRTPPQAYPDATGLWAVGYSIRPLGYADSIDGYGRDSQSGGALVTIQFSTLDWDPTSTNQDGTPTSTFVSEELDMSAGVQTVPGSSYEFESDNAAVTQDVGIIQGEANYTITIHESPVLDWSTISGLIGKVNNATFRGFAAGKLLYGGARAHRVTTTQGVQAWQITHLFLWKSNFHNKILRPDGNSYDFIREKITGLRPFQAASFEPLLYQAL